MRSLFHVLPFAAFACIPLPAHAGSDAAGGPALTCRRPAAGSVVIPPPDLFSADGVLNVTLNYYTSMDSDGRTLFCFKTPNGLESPTLHVQPGDTLNITVNNKAPPLPAGVATHPLSNALAVCGDRIMTGTSVNMHFHGTNTSPDCHGDQVIHTIINSGQTFVYRLKFPEDEPPGLYWYHPHIHGIAEAAVQGGASGAIVVEGIEKLQPEVAGLPERILILRDQTVAGNPDPGGIVPAWDVSLNYVPISYPNFTPAIIRMAPGQKELWRVVNASADTVFDTQLLFDGAPQSLRVVALDGVPTGSQDGTRRGKAYNATDLLIPPAGRAEFIVAGPPQSVGNATFTTNNIDTGPLGDNDPQRTLAVIRQIKPAADEQMAGMQMNGMVEDDTPRALPLHPGKPNAQRFEGLSDARVTAQRTLYFSEVVSDPSNPASPTNFFITVDGAKPKLFSPDNPPAIITHQGAVEDWTIENRAGEVHEFHMHQIHFLLLKRFGVPVPDSERQFMDMIQLPYWSGKGPYPSVTVRMDFRGMDVGDFVYHCHILGHEDNGMMAIIRVLPRQPT